MLGALMDNVAGDEVVVPTVTVTLTETGGVPSDATSVEERENDNVPLLELYVVALDGSAPTFTVAPLAKLDPNTVIA